MPFLIIGFILTLLQVFLLIIAVIIDFLQTIMWFFIKNIKFINKSEIKRPSNYIEMAKYFNKK